MSQPKASAAAAGGRAESGNLITMQRVEAREGPELRGTGHSRQARREENRRLRQGCGAVQ